MPQLPHLRKGAPCGWHFYETKAKVTPPPPKLLNCACKQGHHDSFHSKPDNLLARSSWRPQKVTGKVETFLRDKTSSSKQFRKACASWVWTRQDAPMRWVKESRGGEGREAPICSQSAAPRGIRHSLSTPEARAWLFPPNGGGAKVASDALESARSKSPSPSLRGQDTAPTPGASWEL